MTKEQCAAAIRLLKEYERIYTEILAMKALLTTVEEHGAFANYNGDGKNSTWTEEFDFLMKSQAAEVIHASVAPILLEIEKAFADAELSRLLAAHPQKGPIN